MKRKSNFVMSLILLLVMAALSVFAAIVGSSIFFFVLAGLFLGNTALFVAKPKIGFVLFLVLAALLLGWQFVTVWNVVNEGWMVMDPISKGVSLLPLILSVVLCAFGAGSISSVARKSGA